MGIKFISKVLLVVTLTFSCGVNAFEIDYHDDLLEENLFLCLEKGDKYCSDLALDLYKNNNLNEALRLNEALCSQNNGQSCNLLGEMHYFGKGASLDYEKAFNYFQKGCELSDGASCRNYALRKFQSSVIFGTDHNSQKMTELLDLGCAYNDALSCSFIKDYDKACNLGLGYGCYQRELLISDALISELPKRNRLISMARNLAEKECQNHDAWGCYTLANLEGLNIDPDLGDIKTYSNQACDYEPFLCKRVGNKYKQKGKYIQASYFYQKGCDSNDLFACMNLAQLYLEDLILPMNYQLTFNLLDKACKEDTGFYFCYVLASNLADNTIIIDDLPKTKLLAFQNYQKVCDRSDDYYPCFKVAEGYFKGEEIDRNLTIALDFAKKACDRSPFKEKSISCFLLANIYHDDEFKGKYEKEAHDILDLMCNVKEINQNYQKNKDFHLDGFSRKACKSLYNEFYSKKRVSTKELSQRATYGQILCLDKDFKVCTDTAKLYIDGKQLPKDKKKAQNLLKVSCAHKDKEACTLLTKLKKSR